MGTNPNNLVGTNGAYGGRTSVNAFNDVLSAFTTAGVVSGWNCAPQSGMVVQLGGDSLSRDVAIAEDPFGNRTTINNREGEPVPVEISAASATTQRIDCVVAYVNSPATVQSTTLDNPEAVGIIDVKGSSSSEPDDEAIRAAITADGGTGSTAYYVILATITVPAGATSITDSEIAQGAATMTEILANSVKSDNIDWTTMSRTLGFRYIGQFRIDATKVISFTDPLGIGSTQYIITLSKGAGDGTSCGVWFLRERAANYGNRALLIAQRSSATALTLTTTESGNTLTCTFGGDSSYSNVHIFAIRTY